MEDRSAGRISLRQLRTFEVVARTGRISQSGDELHRSPSAVSRTISQLEATLGCILLHRDQASFTPTSAGNLVIRRSAIIRDELAFCRNQLVRFHGIPVPESGALFNMQLDCKHLRTFLAIHNFRSLHRAAHNLSLSQPAVSYSLRLLESDVGAELFTRLPNGVIPTPAGETLALSARRVLADVARMYDDVRSVEGTSTGLVCIGALAYSRSAILPAALQLALRRYPNISIRTVEGHIDHLIAGLHNGELDAILCAYPNRSLLDHVDVTTITQDRLGFFVRTAHPLAKKESVTLPELLAFHFIMPPLGTITRELLEGFFVNNGLPRPFGRVETSSYSLVRNLLLGSDLIAFRSRREFLADQSTGNTVSLNMCVPDPEREICLLQRRGAHPTEAVRKFLDIVREVSDASVACSLHMDGHNLGP